MQHARSSPLLNGVMQKLFNRFQHRLATNFTLSFRDLPLSYSVGSTDCYLKRAVSEAIALSEKTATQAYHPLG
jgi:hypothetical protein